MVPQSNALADLFCRAARVRIEQLFGSFYGDFDGEMYRVAQQVMRGEHAWLESGIIALIDDDASQVAEAALARELEPAQPV